LAVVLTVILVFVASALAAPIQDCSDDIGCAIGGLAIGAGVSAGMSIRLAVVLTVILVFVASALATPIQDYSDDDETKGW